MTTHPWKPRDQVFSRFYDMATSGYVIELLGRVTSVGKAGFTVRVSRPGQTGPRVRQYGHSVDGLWPTKEEGEAAIAARPFSTGRVERE